MKNKLILCTLLCSASVFAKPVSKYNPDGKVNYPSNFQVENGWNLFVFGDYLYWNARENGLYFAKTNHIHRLEPEWNNGLRIGAGINFPNEGYDLLGIWTWFSTHAHSTIGLSIPLWAVATLEAFARKTTAEWNLQQNSADLEWGRSSWFGGHLSWRPFFGLRGAKIDQNLKIDYTYVIQNGSQHSRSDFIGGGLRAGSDLRFALPCDFGICALMSGSLLMGRIDAELRLKENKTLAAHTKDHFWRMVPALQMALKLSWDRHLYRDRLHLALYAGWEQNIWFGINQMNHFMNPLEGVRFFKENSNLCTQGLVAGGRFSF